MDMDRLHLLLHMVLLNQVMELPAMDMELLPETLGPVVENTEL